MSTLKFNKWQSIDGVTRNAVLQVVSKEVTTAFATTSTSFLDATDMFLAITPTSATSKIIVTFYPALVLTRSAAGNYADFQILRDSTVVFRPGHNNGTGNIFYGMNASGATVMNLRGSIPLCFLDSPSTTSEIVYKMKTSIYLNTNSATFTINLNGSKSTITLMEIAQ